MPAIPVTVLSGKGGTAKTLWQMMLAGEASRLGLRTLLIDIDPERNLSTKFGAPQHHTGLGNVLEDAGALTGSAPDPERGAKRAAAEISPTAWEHVDLLPAGATLAGLSQVAISEHWLLRDILAAAGVPDRYDVVLIDTGGRTGSLVTLAMYAADKAYAPVSPQTAATNKALEARERVDRIQRAHPLQWVGVVVTGFDLRSGIEGAIRGDVFEKLGDQVRAEVPARSAVKECFETTDRLGDRRDAPTANLARIFRGFLERDLLGRPGYPEGVLR